MRATLAAGAAAGLLIFAVQAQSGREPSAAAPAARPDPPLDWAQWRASLAPAPPSPEPQFAAAEAAADGLDVVDAHWMALTMWGEARGQGEAAMRAVGHVIDNRRRAGRHGDFVTETVSEAWQFSCWNSGDPNRSAIENVDRLPRGGHDHRMWRAARSIADEILAGRSTDPTDGALFYHADGVAPSWSAGIPPVAHIGGHLFFRSARRSGA